MGGGPSSSDLFNFSGDLIIGGLVVLAILAVLVVSFVIVAAQKTDTSENNKK